MSSFCFSMHMPTFLFAIFHFVLPSFLENTYKISSVHLMMWSRAHFDEWIYHHRIFLELYAGVYVLCYGSRYIFRLKWALNEWLVFTLQITRNHFYIKNSFYLKWYNGDNAVSYSIAGSFFLLWIYYKYKIFGWNLNHSILLFD